MKRHGCKGKQVRKPHRDVEVKGETGDTEGADVLMRHKSRLGGSALGRWAFPTGMMGENV